MRTRPRWYVFIHCLRSVSIPSTKHWFQKRSQFPPSSNGQLTYIVSCLAPMRPAQTFAAWRRLRATKRRRPRSDCHHYKQLLKFWNCLKLGDECISTRQNSSATLYSFQLQAFNKCFLERGTFLASIHPESMKCDDQNCYPTLQMWHLTDDYVGCSTASVLEKMGSFFLSIYFLTSANERPSV